MQTEASAPDLGSQVTISTAARTARVVASNVARNSEATMSVNRMVAVTTAPSGA